MKTLHHPYPHLHYHLFFFFLLIINTNAFNIDVHYPIVKRGLRGSFFGYSVAQHTIGGYSGKNQHHVILVGAPRQRNYDNETVGELFRCSPSSYRHDDCISVYINLKSNPQETMNQWLGSSIVSQRMPKGKAVVCAPRFRNVDEGYVRSPGICVTLTNRLKVEEFLEPCLGRSIYQGHEGYGLCQAGFGLDIFEDGEVLIGAPGVISWSGMVFAKKPALSLEDDEKWVNSLAGSVSIGQNTFFPPTRYYSYLGMSAMFGNINHKKTYVVGAPRSAESGQVFLMQRIGDDLVVEESRTLTGPSFGSSFGHSISIVDLNADGMDDLVVGAPLEWNGSRGSGAVYVYLNTINGITKETEPQKIMNREMTEQECLKMNCVDARFGFSLSHLGDVDGDGYQDLAVGAPYEDNGAVYIFHGGKNGIRKEYSQRISGSDLRPSLKTFGHSLASGIDLDSNGDPDLTVGAYGSDAVVIFRTRSVIEGKATIETTPESIDPFNEGCKSGEKACFHLKTCFRLTIHARNNLKDSLFINYKMASEPMLGSSLHRIRFNNPLGKSYSHKKLFEMTKPERCIDQKIYLNALNKDYYNPVVFKLSFSLSDKNGNRLLSHQSKPPHTLHRTAPDINQMPILSGVTFNTTHLIHFKKNCANGDQCVSNLKLTASINKADKTSAGEYVVTVGDTKEIVLNIEVQNNEEEAHEARLFVRLPPMITHEGTDDKGKQYSCNYEGDLVSCNLGNPLKGNYVLSFGIRLDASALDATTNDTTISLFVNTTSTEDETSDDKSEVVLKVIVEAEMEIRGKSDPIETYFGEKKNKKDANSKLITSEEDIGPLVSHSYEVKNLKGGKVAESLLVVEWPIELRHEFNSDTETKHLLYLLDFQPDENMKCEMLNQSYSLNPLNVYRHIENSTTTHESRKRSTRSTTNEAIKGFFRNPRSGRTVVLSCGVGDVVCVVFRCVVGQLTEGQSSVVKIVSRLWESTFLEEFMDMDKVKVSSRARISIDKKWSIYQSSTKNDISETFTTVVPDQELVKPHSLDMWMVLLALCLGLLSLLLLVFMLWKWGFFNRSKLADVPFHQARLINQPRFL